MSIHCSSYSNYKCEFVSQESTRSTALKINLDVNVKAPKILLPLDSLRREGFMLDLGHIGISNSFQVIPETASMESKAIVDIIALDLSGLTLYRY